MNERDERVTTMAELTESYEFGVEGIPTLQIRNRAGIITITRGNSGQVSVQVTKRARGRLFSQATEDDLARLVVNVSQHGSQIRVETEQRELGGILKNCQVDIAITTPAETNTELRMNAGNVEVRDIAGSVEGVVNAGNFDAFGVTLANRSSLTVNAGNLTLEGAVAAGASLHAEVNAGNLRLRLPRNTPAYLEARTDVGAIDVDGWPVSISRRMVQQEAGGALGENPQGTLRLRVNTGSITVQAM